MTESNSIVILIPLLNFANYRIILNKPFKSLSYLDYDREKNFEIWEKLNILNQEPFDRGNENLKKYYCKTILPNKILISIDIFHLQGINNEQEKNEGFFFLKLELYSPNTNIDYSRIVQYYYSNRTKFIDFIITLIKERNLIHTDILEGMKDVATTFPLIHFNLLYYKLKNETKITTLKELYSTRFDIITDSQFHISADTHGTKLLFVNKRKTHRSSSNLKVMVIRCFLLRFFTWIYDNDSMLYLNLRKRFFKYYNYLINTSTNRDLYSKLKDLKNYCFDLKLELAIFDTNNQSRFLAVNSCEINIKAIEKFLVESSIHHFSLLKYAFITEKNYKPKVTNILEKNNWNLIYTLKESRSDYDAILLSFLDQLCTLYSKNWGRVYVITADSNLVNGFFRKFSFIVENQLVFITDKEELHLNNHPLLYKKKQSDYDFYLYIEK